MDKDYILEEIKRTALLNDGVPLGKTRFLKETGIRETDWSGKYWTRWSAAVSEAGFIPQTLQLPGNRKDALAKVVALIRRLGKLPTVAEMKIEKRNDPSFPNKTSLLRRGSRETLVLELLDYCNANDGNEDVRLLLPQLRRITTTPQVQAPENQGTSQVGTVYLIHSGHHYKIGITSALYRRASEIANGNPYGAELIHSFETDDPRGIEAYWHNRFADKRVRGKNVESGEWFNLNKSDVAAFRKRKKFM